MCVGLQNIFQVRKGFSCSKAGELLVYTIFIITVTTTTTTIIIIKGFYACLLRHEAYNSCRCLSHEGKQQQ
jgi:hypothetical protein